MTEDKIDAARQSRRINPQKNYEIRHWSRMLRCTEAQLREAVLVAGNDADDVARYLSQVSGQSG